MGKPANKPADEQSLSGPKSTFEAYRAEGDMLFKQQEFKKALESYNQALDMRADERNCLVARSRCYLQMGDTDNALRDAESSMADDPAFFKGLLCKADALYFRGDFEMALVFYHRGNKMRPEQHEFRLGIQKCQEAIENSVGTPDKVKLSKEGDLTYFYKPQEEEAAQKRKQQMMRPGRRQAQEQKKQERPISGKKDRTIKQLLGALYADREYLEKLLKEEDGRLDALGTCPKCKYKLNVCSCNVSVDLDRKYGEDGQDNMKVYSEKFRTKKLQMVVEENKPKEDDYHFDDEEPAKDVRKPKKQIDAKEKKTRTSEAIHNLALNGLLYLDTRTDFWRQQKPMYARKRDKELQRVKSARDSRSDPVNFTLRKLTEIDDAHTRGRYKQVLRESNKTLKTVDSWSEEDLANKTEVEANLHSYAGNAHLELGHYDKALEEHEMDLQLANEIENDELKSRAMDNLGRVYARMGRFQDAIKVWEKKAENKKDSIQDLEGAWIYHELGRCYLETGDAAKAKEYGEKSNSYAQSAEDDVWLLHSNVLIAQSEAKQGDYQASVESFERALDLAKVQGENDSKKAIQRALDAVNEKIVDGLRNPSPIDDGKELEDDDANEEEEDDGYDQDFDEEKGAPQIEASCQSASPILGKPMHDLTPFELDSSIGHINREQNSNAERIENMENEYEVEDSKEKKDLTDSQMSREQPESKAVSDQSEKCLQSLKETIGIDNTACIKDSVRTDSKTSCTQPDDLVVEVNAAPSADGRDNSKLYSDEMVQRSPDRQNSATPNSRQSLTSPEPASAAHEEIERKINSRQSSISSLHSQKEVMSSKSFTSHQGDENKAGSMESLYHSSLQSGSIESLISSEIKTAKVPTNCTTEEQSSSRPQTARNSATTNSVTRVESRASEDAFLSPKVPEDPKTNNEPLDSERYEQQEAVLLGVHEDDKKLDMNAVKSAALSVASSNGRSSNGYTESVRGEIGPRESLKSTLGNDTKSISSKGSSAESPQPERDQDHDTEVARIIHTSAGPPKARQDKDTESISSKDGFFGSAHPEQGSETKSAISDFGLAASSKLNQGSDIESIRRNARSIKSVRSTLKSAERHQSIDSIMSGSLGSETSMKSLKSERFIKSMKLRGSTSSVKSASSMSSVRSGKSKNPDTPVKGHTYPKSTSDVKGIKSENGQTADSSTKLQKGDGSHVEDEDEESDGQKKEAAK